MDPARASKTALLVTLYRALDCELLDPPLLGDSFAARMLSAEERAEYESAVHEMFCAAHPELRREPRTEALRKGCARNRATLPGVLARARFADDALAAAIERGATQFVMVGAGLDTFVLRRPDLARRVATFEVDHPATQAEKRRRLKRLGPLPPAHYFAGCDFESQDVASALASLPFDRSAPTLFAWLGVTWYLTRPAIEATLRAMRRAAERCELVFDYRLRASIDPAEPAPELAALQQLLRSYGEPAITGFDRATLGDALAPLGFAVVEDAGADVLEPRYFGSRSDGFGCGPFHRVVRARSTPRP
jgi:methyltransferase (TIGR00027 family)